MTWVSLHVHHCSRCLRAAVSVQIPGDAFGGHVPFGFGPPPPVEAGLPNLPGEPRHQGPPLPATQYTRRPDNLPPPLRPFHGSMPDPGSGIGLNPPGRGLPDLPKIPYDAPLPQQGSHIARNGPFLMEGMSGVHQDGGFRGQPGPRPFEPANLGQPGPGGGLPLSGLAQERPPFLGGTMPPPLPLGGPDGAGGDRPGSRPLDQPVLPGLTLWFHALLWGVMPSC
jgi:hypothetical protein